MLTAYLTNVVRHVEETQDRFRHLVCADVAARPIPFFGNLVEADVLTVGVNPSCGEFRHRNWPTAPVTNIYLQSRLLNYFSQSTTPPHRWFETWERALGYIHRSFRECGAAHLDLSPRATKAMRGCDPDSFLQMIEHDVSLFFEAIRLCPRARLILIAGAVTSKFYMHEFLRKEAPKHGLALAGSFRRKRGPGWMEFLKLSDAGRTFRVVFTSISPSSQHRNLLVERIAENRDVLSEFLSSKDGGDFGANN